MDPPRIVAVRFHQAATLLHQPRGVQPGLWDLALAFSQLAVNGEVGLEHRLICGGPATVRGWELQAATGVTVAAPDQPLAQLAAGAVLDVGFWLGTAGVPVGVMEHGYLPLCPLPAGLDECSVSAVCAGLTATREPAADPRHLTWRGVAKPGFSVTSGEVLAGLCDAAGADRSLRCPAGGPWQVAAVTADADRLSFVLLRLRYNGAGETRP